MSDTVKQPVIRNRGFNTISKEDHRKASSKGGKKKGVKKGFAYMAEHDPERFREIVEARKVQNRLRRRTKLHNDSE